VGYVDQLSQDPRDIHDVPSPSPGTRGDNLTDGVRTDACIGCVLQRRAERVSFSRR